MILVRVRSVGSALTVNYFNDILIASKAIEVFGNVSFDLRTKKEGNVNQCYVHSDFAEGSSKPLVSWEGCGTPFMPTYSHVSSTVVQGEAHFFRGERGGEGLVAVCLRAHSAKR